ncbi:PEGA domain-containing protein, partial [Methanosarcina spelaei]|uniref:PEGA domain-containing protein n=1 Tax=Methanosarcina spelaei TaxID=1036679 RepID=UPI0034E0B246
MSVTSSPTGADIFLDDTYEGETPKILEDVKQGSHTVTLTLTEYKDWSKDISIEADKTVSVSPTLTPTESSK